MQYSVKDGDLLLYLVDIFDITVKN